MNDQLSGGSMPSSEERRRFPRIRAGWSATVEAAEGRVAGAEVVDVSFSGMKVKTETTAPVGAPVTLRVTLPHGAGRIELVARVVRRDFDGIGVDFRGLSEDAAERLAPFVFPVGTFGGPRFA